MGERPGDGAGHSRRREHPAGRSAADTDTTAADDVARPTEPGLEALLAQALLARDPSGTGARADLVPDVGGDGGSDGERRAVAAFRAARDAGAHRARTRRRDDWRPRARRHTVRSLKATLSALVAGLALGGVAFAAIDSATDGRADAEGRPERPVTAAASGARSTGPSVSAPPAAPADRDRPVSAKDTEAHCRAYEKVRGRGRAMDSTAWQRLVTAAGGEENVAAYCAAQGGPKGEKAAKGDRTPKADRTVNADATSKTGNAPEPTESQKAAKAGKPADADGTGTAEDTAKAAKGGAEGE
ncbi:hypothetical protein [Streptomyces sp. NPDC005859]|uniref:hypothetical protein n=1 Tax=Streptomyces sp. NPDC005859 TaxID=3157170 RepID=UPI0033E32AFC